MARRNIYSLRDVMPQQARQSILSSRPSTKPRTRNIELLARCNQAWENLREVRETRDRIMNYCYGDQWGDVIEYDGGVITERSYIKKQNTVPLVNNVMISILNSTVGLYAKQGAEPVCFARAHNAQWLSDMMSATMQCNWQNTMMPDLLKHAFEDYLIGGVSVMRESYEEKDQIYDAWTEYYDPNYVFWEGGYDVRHVDMELIGVLHDISPEDLFKMFAKKEYGLTKESLQKIFHILPDDTIYRKYYTDGMQLNEKHDIDNVTFETPSNPRMCRVIEVWYKDTKKRYQCYDPIANSMDETYYRVEMEDIKGIDEINRQRKKLYDEVGLPEEERPYITKELIDDTYWKYTYMAPDGTVLCEGETPYDFHSHPFTIKLYPFINGQIHPYMGNIIDQQRYINRLIVMHDMAARSAAKGVTIVPIECIPDGMTPQDFADNFTAYDGLVFYNASKVNPNLRPEIITSNAVQIGTYELLQLQMQLIRDISNVSGALQGKTPSAGTSASRYAQETQNATTSLYTVLFDFTSLTEALADKKCQIIKQYYDDKRLIYNKANSNDMLEYDRLSARDVKFMISIKEAAATAAYQTQANDTLLQVLQLPPDMMQLFLQNCNLPFADKLLQQIQSQQMQMQQEAMMQQQMEAEKADPEKVRQAEQILGKPN